MDIERALNDDLSKEPKKRNLQLEAKAHIAVQRWIDEGGLRQHESKVEGILATNALSKLGIIAAGGARADWRLTFPARLAPRIAPGLFPE